MDNLAKQIATDLNIKEEQVKNTIALIDEGNTIIINGYYK